MNNLNLKDKCFFIKSNLFKKKNILLSIILVLFILILLLCFNLIYFVIDYKNTNFEKNVDMRTLLVYGDENSDYSKINDIAHVIYNDSTKFYNGFSAEISEFDVEDLTGYVNFFPLHYSNEIEVIEGRNIKNNNEAVCPVNFYPHSVYESEQSTTIKIYPNYYLKKDKILGRTFIIPSNNENNSDINVEIVGLYSTKSNLKSINTCYISLNDYAKLASPYSAIITSTYPDGTEETEYVEHKGNMVIVDDYKNVSKVKDEIIKMDFSVYEAMYLEEETLSFMIIVPLLISIIVIILSLNIIYSFISKKIKYRLHSYGILKALGYSKKAIISIDLLENVLVFLISFIISFIIYLIAYIILMNTILVEFTYESVMIKIPFLYIIPFIIVFIGMIILICKIKLNKTLKVSTNEILKN